MSTLVTAHSNDVLGILLASDGKVISALFERDARLAAFGFLMLLLAAVLAVGMLFDSRQIREVSVWLKPLKFALSTAAFALTSAWLLGVLPIAERQSSAVTFATWTLIVSAGFEVAYITFQGALAQASHYNISSGFHSAMFGLMAFAAVALTATQAIYAWQIFRSYGLNVITNQSPVVLSVIAGFILTFVLGTISGFMLGGKQPPSGAGIALLGWQFNANDFRPAHFLGVHAHQLIPITGIFIQKYAPSTTGAVLVAIVSSAYVVLWIAAARI